MLTSRSSLKLWLSWYKLTEIGLRLFYRIKLYRSWVIHSSEYCPLRFAWRSYDFIPRWIVLQISEHLLRNFRCLASFGNFITTISCLLYFSLLISNTLSQAVPHRSVPDLPILILVFRTVHCGYFPYYHFGRSSLRMSQPLWYLCLYIMLL